MLLAFITGIQKVIDQERYIACALPQGGKYNGKGIETEIKVFAKFFLLDQFSQVLVGR